MTNDFEGVTLIFDLDGTLVDTAGDLAASMNYALTKAGRAQVPTRDVRHLVGHGARRMLAQGFELTGDAADDATLDEGLAQFLEHYQRNIAVDSEMFSGVDAMMSNFARYGAKLAVCTNKREKLAVRLLDKLGIVDRFAIIVGADTTNRSKPDPAPVRLCLSATNAERAIFFGDSDTDIKAALAAGLPVLVAEFGYGPLELSASATGIFDSYHEAEKLARSLLAGSAFQSRGLPS